MIKYQYNISKTADNQVFYSVCKEIENLISDRIVKKSELLIDVDGSLVQVYKINNDEIIAQNDYEVDAVYVDSAIDLGRLGFPYEMKLKNMFPPMAV